jgi:hypothetical protein
MTLMKPIPGYTVPGLQLDRVCPENADDPPDVHPYLLPGLQLDRVGPEDAHDTHEAHPWLHCTWSLA